MARIPASKEAQAKEFAESALEHGAAIRDMDRRSSMQIHTVERNDVRLDEIKPRIGVEVRLPDVGHALDLAASIAYIKGLIHPIAIDTEHHLLAGGHRLFALKVLDMDPERRRDWIVTEVVEKRADCQNLDNLEDLAVQAALLPQLSGILRVNVMTKPDGVTDWAFAVEVAENEKRRDLSKKQLNDLKERLVERGMSFGERGKPTKEDLNIPRTERIGIAWMAASIGKSERQIRRLLGPEKPERMRSSADQILAKALKQYLKNDVDPERRKWAEAGLLLIEGQ